MRQLMQGTDEIETVAEITEPVRPAGNMAQVMKLIAGIRFLVRGWLPFAMLTMVLGPPGVGKSIWVLFALVRPIICGGLNWFHGLIGPTEPGNVLWCDTEGSAAINAQRIKDFGLPAERIKVPYEDDPLVAINLNSEEHLAQIEAVILKYQIKLVVIDSLRGAHGGEENSSKMAEPLQRLAEIGQRTGAAIIVIHHTRKLQADEEISDNSSRGSNAIIAMVRSQIGIYQPDPKNEWRKLLMLKENLGLRPTPIGFRISSAGLEFGPAPDRPHKHTEKDRAAEWLKAHMQPGRWYKAADLEDAAAKAKLSETALRRARDDLGITKPDHLRRVKDGWEWKLPQGVGKALGENEDALTS
jgi:hypothetical protein